MRNETKAVKAMRKNGQLPEWCDRTMFYGSAYTLCTNEEMFRNELKRLGSKRTDVEFLRASFHACVHTLESASGDEIHVVCIDGQAAKDRDPISVAAMLVHEATHIKQYVMERIGEKNPSDEFEAYVMQHITQNLLAEYRRQMYPKVSKD